MAANSAMSMATSDVSLKEQIRVFAPSFFHLEPCKEFGPFSKFWSEFLTLPTGPHFVIIKGTFRNLPLKITNQQGAKSLIEVQNYLLLGHPVYKPDCANQGAFSEFAPRTVQTQPPISSKTDNISAALDDAPYRFTVAQRHHETGKFTSVTQPHQKNAVVFNDCRSNALIDAPSILKDHDLNISHRDTSPCRIPGCRRASKIRPRTAPIRGVRRSIAHGQTRVVQG